MKNNWIAEPLTAEEQAMTGVTKSFTKANNVSRVMSWRYPREIGGDNTPMFGTQEDQDAVYKRYYDDYGSDRFK